MDPDYGRYRVRDVTRDVHYQTQQRERIEALKFLGTGLLYADGAGFILERTGIRFLSRTIAADASGLARVNPFEVRFSQPTISQNFSGGRTLQETVDALRSGATQAGEIQTIRVVEYNGQLFTLDNRRLAAFQAAGVESIPIQRVSLSNARIGEEFAEKLNPINGGTVIVITPNAAGRGAAEAALKEHGKIR